MTVRKGNSKDLSPVCKLLEKLGYHARPALVLSQLKEFEQSAKDAVWVYQADKEITGFATVHFLPQLGFDGGLAIITFLSAENGLAAKALEKHITDFAYDNLCDRIQVHCADFRKDDHRF